MTPEQLEIVGTTATAVEGAPERFAHSFYDRLFEIEPNARALFPDDMSAQRAKLVEEVVFLAEVASDLDGFLDRARELGMRHRHYGVRAHDYGAVRVALVHALGSVLGDECTTDVEAAWCRLYDLVAETMLEGATGELFAEP